MAADETISFRRNVPVRHTVDVFVAGGGPAGVAAAATAARQGRSVFLAEGHTCFGGMGTAGLVPAFMQFTDRVNFLAGGIGREIHDRLFDANGVGPGDRRDDLWGGMGIKAEVLKRVLDDTVVESKADFTFQTNLIDVQVKGSRVACAVCAAKSGVFAVKAKIYVDCIGDGDLAAWAGAPFEKGDEDGNLMPGTLCNVWANIDWQTVCEKNRWSESSLPQAIKDGVFTIPDYHLPGMWWIGENIGGGNIGHTFGVDNTDERSVTTALLWGRKLVLEYERFLKQYQKGYEKAELVATGSLLGVRETRRIMGDYLLNLDDFKKRAVFEDEIGRYAYPVDIHQSKPGEQGFKKLMEDMRVLSCGPGESYGIPYRSLVPRKLANVLVAGRCLSADRYVQGSVRCMPGCFITGQAVGMAAAIAAEKSVETRDVQPKELQARLKKMGAYLPNA